MTCALTSTPKSTSVFAPTSTSSGGGVFKAGAGVIGASVTLGVLLGIEALVMLPGGLKLGSKKRLGASPSGNVTKPKA